MRFSEASVKALAMVIFLGLLISSADAQKTGAVVTKNKENYFRLRLPAGWSQVTPAAGREKILASYRNDKTGQILAVTRVSYPNRAVYRWKTAKKYREQVEAGFKNATKNYKKLKKRRFKLGRVPAMDLFFQHGDGEVVMVRFLFFRTFSLSLSIAGKADSYERERKPTGAILDSFRPYWG